MSASDLRSGGELRPLPDPRHTEIVSALVQRGVREDRARKLLLDLPDDQPVLDQIEWADAEIARKQRSNDPVANPPGFYIYLLRSNYPVPANFETSRKRRAREESKKKDLDSRAREAQQELEIHEKRERYEEFLIEQTDVQLKKLSAAKHRTACECAYEAHQGGVAPVPMVGSDPSGLRLAAAAIGDRRGVESAKL